jgi:diphthine-ammonia ligase
VDKANVAVSWSGGKDSCLALYRAMKSGYRVNRLLNFISRDSLRCCFHGIPLELMKMQAEALGIPLVTHPMPDDMHEYEQEFKRALSRLSGISGMVFGDIYLDEHKAWVERVCGSMGISCIEPLWNQPTAALMEEFIELGFKAVVVSAKADLFGIRRQDL